MKISKKIVNGKPYFYALDSIYINRGKTIPKNKSLGPAATTTNFVEKKREFLRYLIREESKLRINYWRSKAGENFLAYTNIAKIEELRAELFQMKRNMGELGATAMETAFLIDFIYNSNKLEGSRVPRESIERIVRETSKEKISEVKNTIAAINYIRQDKFTFTLRNIEKLHDMLIAHEPNNLKYRTNNDVVVGNSRVSDFKNIKKELTQLLKENAERNYTLYPLEQAFLFYYKFERIHPFNDGNGRTGRLLMNEILKMHKYHPIIIWNVNRQAHMNAFEKAVNGRLSSFFNFMAEQFIKTHEIYLKKISDAYNLDTVMQSFLKPSIQEA
jgi:cell filamentation protein, protein adenylyltransferase